MFVIIGIVVVLGAVVGGYLMEHGNLKVLLQPAELVVIGGAALGTLLIANPLHILKAIIGGMLGTLSGSKYNQATYLETLKMMYELQPRAQRRADGPGSGQRRAGQEPGVLQVSEISERSPCTGFCVRHHPHGFRRRRGSF